MRLAPLVACCLALSAQTVPERRPLPLVQATPQPYEQIAFTRGPLEIARLHYGPALLRPFVYPVIGPGGHGLTRMGHPGDPHGHSHHNSIWISLSDVDGVDFWSDRGGGRIVHDRILRLEDGDTRAAAVTEASWRAADGRVLLRERRHTVVETLPAGEWLLILDVQLSGDATIGKGSFGPVGVRMAKSIGTHHGGGVIRGSEGGVNEAALFRKPARWMDYSGQTGPGVIEGVTLFDHPDNPRHPAPFHVREDGWMGAMVALDAPVRIAPDRPLSLRYAVYVHAGFPEPAALDRQWKRFAAAPLRPPFGPPTAAKDCRHGDFRRFTVPREFATQADCEAAVR
ncbi:MAG: PmoA family protein [Bryobacterales bacterium]|nr:PmoA family protein [Bryobacterales bacterium]